MAEISQKTVSGLSRSGSVPKNELTPVTQLQTNVFSPPLISESHTTVQGNASLATEYETEVKGDTTLFRRHKRLFVCCGITLFFHIIAAILIVILIFTVFKTKKPTFTVSSMKFQNLNTSLDIHTFSISTNVTLDLDIHVKNPNYASFKYSNSTAFIYYHGEGIGEAAVPAGRVGSRGSETLSTACSIFVDRLLSNKNLISDIGSGDFPLSTHTDITGRINFLHVFKRHARATTDCSMIYALQSQSLQNTTCTYHVKL
eukprot:c13601_g1_i1 orf=228-1001(+)